MVEVIETLVAVKTSVAMPDLDFRDLTKDLIPKDLTKTMAALVNTTPLVKKHLKPGPVSSELIDLLPLMKKHLKPGPVSSELIDLLHRSGHSRAGHLNLRQETQNADFMVMLKCPTLRHKCATLIDLVKDLMRPSLTSETGASYQDFKQDPLHL